MRALKAFFINRDFGLLFCGRLVSQIGDGIHYFAMAWLVLDLTGSGTALGTMLMAAAIPGIILTPFTGVLADMWNRKRIVVSMDIVRGLLLLGTAGMYAANSLTLPMIYVVTILLSLCGVLFGPAITATVPGLVKREELVQANSRDALSHGATGILGPIAGAFLLGSIGYLGIFIFNGVSFLISAVSEMFIRFPVQTTVTPAADGSRSTTGSIRLRTQVESFAASMKDGFRYLWGSPGLRVIIGGGILLNFLFSPLFGVVFPYFGKEVLQMDPELFGMSQSSIPVGMLLGTVLVGVMVGRFRKLHLLIGSVTAQGIAIASMALLAIPAVYLSLPPWGMLLGLAGPLLALGFLNVQVNVPINVMMQETVPDHYRGRVFSLLGSTMNLAAPLGMGLFGILLDRVPIHFFFLVCGLLIAGMAMVLGTSSGLRQLCRANEISNSKPEAGGERQGEHDPRNTQGVDAPGLAPAAARTNGKELVANG